ncbi:hypothetical protein BDW74DRAFT_182179 [Aspergillus multicolor]|uniref:uncharacterized protein n=1 Tax=Aspergillus multicolor TaxID=41759 RepID=UPI003CCDA42B
MAEITYAAFNATIRAAVFTQSKKYASYHSLSLHWDTEPTVPAGVQNFQLLLKLLHLPPAREVALPKNHRIPGCIIKTGTPGKALVIILYAGHAVRTQDGRFAFVKHAVAGPDPDRDAVPKIDAEHWLLRIAHPTWLEFKHSIDILFLFDCPEFAAEAKPPVREPETTPRTV